MAAIFNYPDLETLVADFSAQKKAWSPQGRLDQLAINANDPAEDGYIFLFYRKFNQRYGDLLRFSLSISEFIDVDFSTQLPGLTLYLNETPGNTVTMWDALSGPAQDTYTARAETLMAQGLLQLQWPTGAQLA